jgi:WD40 repeat protein
VAGQVHHASFSPDGRRIVTGSRDGTARIWDAGTGAEILSLRHGRYVMHASFRPDGRWLATAGQAATGEYEVALWDLRSGAKLFSLPHDAPVIHTEFAPDGRTLLTAAFSRVIRVWDLGRRQEIVAMRRPDGNRATFSPDGTRLAFVEKSTSVAIYDAGHGRPLVSGLRNDNYAINHLAFAPDGRSLLIVSEGSARIYDARTGVPLTPPLMHQATSGMAHAAFSRDGRRVVTVATDSSARVWDTDTGQALTPPIEHRAGVRHGAFSHDGLRMAATGGDAVHLWDLSGPASPASDAQLALQAQVLAARRIDATGAVVPLGAVEFRDAWARFRAEARATR